MLVVLFLLGAFIVNGQKNPGKLNTDNISMDSVVRYGKLENGFTYYLRKNDKPENFIELQMVVKAGMYHEEKNQLGYAHLLEHLKAKESKNFPDIIEYFSHSGKFSNAKTGYGHTSYYVQIPADNQEVLKAGLKVLRDWAQDFSLKPESINVEQAAVLGEMRTHDPYRNWVANTIKEHIHKNVGFKYTSREQEKASILDIDQNALIRFHNDWYRPDLEAAIIVGDINVDSLEIEIQRLFSDLKTPSTPKSAENKVQGQRIQLNGRNQYASVLDTVHPDFRVEIIRKSPNFYHSPKTGLDYRKMFLQRLYEIVLEIKATQLEQQYNPPFSKFYPDYSSNNLGGGQIYATRMTVDLNKGSQKEIKTAFIKGLSAWKSLHNGFSTEEMEKAKEQILNNYNNSNSLRSSSLVQRYMKHFIKGTAAPNPETQAKIVSDILSIINLEELQEYATRSANFTKNTDFIFFKSQDKNVPGLDVFKQWVEEAAEMKIQPSQPAAPPIKTLADVTKIPYKDFRDEIEISESVIGVTTINLHNQIKLVLKPTKPNSENFANKVYLKAFRPFTPPISDRKEYLTAKIAPEVIKYTGAGPYSKFELERFMKQKEMRLELSTNQDSQLIQGEFKVTDLKELLNLLLLYTEKPKKDIEGFEAWKSYKEKQLQGRGIRGSAAFILKKISPIWYPEIPGLKISDLKKMDMEQLFQVYERWFSDLNGFTFIITGDFDKEAITPILVNNLSLFPIKDSYEYPAVNPTFPLKKMNKIITVKNIDQVYARLYFPIVAPRDLKTQIELKLLSLALAKKIINRLREGDYAPSARGEWMDIENNIYAFQIIFDSALGNEDIMLEYALDEFRKLRDNGVDKQWLENAIADELKYFEGGFSGFGYFNFWSDFLKVKLKNNENPTKAVLEYGTILEHFISLYDVNEAAKKYLSEENLQQFLAFPVDYPQ